jgi:hypothetical protein
VTFLQCRFMLGRTVLVWADALPAVSSFTVDTLPFCARSLEAMWKKRYPPVPSGSLEFVRLAMSEKE